MKKGDIVLVKATVETTYSLPLVEHEVIHTPLKLYGKRPIKYLVCYRIKKPWTGLIVGYSYRYTGYLHYGPEPEQSALSSDKTHKVWLVEPIDSDRWFNPFACLEEDLELINDT